MIEELKRMLGIVDVRVGGDPYLWPESKKINQRIARKRAKWVKR